MNLIKDKRGNFIIILFFFTVVAVLIAGALFLIFGAAAVDLVMDEVTPEIVGIGEVGPANFTEYSEYSIVPFNSFIQQLKWITGVIYILALLGLFGMSFVYRSSGSRILLPIFFLMAFLLIMMSILVSNIYEDFYNDSGDFADRLKEQVLLSWLILNSPIVFTVIIFMSGIVLFSGIGQEEFI